MKHCKTCKQFFAPTDQNQFNDEGRRHAKCSSELNVTQEYYCDTHEVRQANNMKCRECGETVSTLKKGRCLAKNCDWEDYVESEIEICQFCYGELEFFDDMYCSNCNKSRNSTEMICGDCSKNIEIKYVGSCARCGHKAILDSDDGICQNCGLLEDMYGLSCTVCRKAHYSDVAVCCGQPVTQSSIVLTKICNPHNVKGSENEKGGYSITVNTDSVEWRLSSGKNLAFERPSYVQAAIKLTDINGNRPTVPVPLSAVDANKKSEIENSVEANSSGKEVDSLEENTFKIDTEAVEKEKLTKDLVFSLGDLQDFDKGHLVALFLGGVDNSWQIVPQVRACNRETWLVMEKDIAKITQDVKRINAFAALKDGNTIAKKKVIMEIFIYYADQQEKYNLGDPRVPVFFYVQLSCKKEKLAHYLIANCLREPTPLPTLEEIELFKLAHNNLKIAYPVPGKLPSWHKWYGNEILYYNDKPSTYTSIKDGHYKSLDLKSDIKVRIDKYVITDKINGLSDEEQKKSLLALIDKTDEGKKEEDTEETSSSSVRRSTRNPKRAKTEIADKKNEQYFNKIVYDLSTTNSPYRALQWLYNQGLIKTPTNVSNSNFQTEQICLIRKYNMWLNGGLMYSDAGPEYKGKDWNKREEPDPFPRLDEASGQAYPEVDHIITKTSKGGTNSYNNARLVSFALNHIYLTKPSYPGEVRGIHEQELTENDIKDAIKIYDKKMEEKKELIEAKAKFSDAFRNIRELHYSGVFHFRNNPDPELKERMKDFASNPKIKYTGSKHFGVSNLSDEIEKLKS